MFNTVEIRSDHGENTDFYSYGIMWIFLAEPLVLESTGDVLITTVQQMWTGNCFFFYNKVPK